MGGMIDLDEIERRIPSRATECSYCHRLATLVCPVCGVLVCEDHRAIHVRETTGTACEGVEMIPAHHDAVTMDRVALVAEVRRLRAELDRMAAARDNAVDLWNRSLDDARRIETQRDEARRIAESRYQDLVDFDGRFRQREASIVSEARRWKVKAVEQSAEVRRLRAALVEVDRHIGCLSHLAAGRACEVITRALYPASPSVAPATLDAGPRDADGREVTP